MWFGMQSSILSECILIALAAIRLISTVHKFMAQNVLPHAACNSVFLPERAQFQIRAFSAAEWIWMLQIGYELFRRNLRQSNYS